MSILTDFHLCDHRSSLVFWEARDMGFNSWYSDLKFGMDKFEMTLPTFDTGISI